MTTTTDSIHILWRTPRVVAARVRDDGGLWDVGWTQGRPWLCTCADEACHHVAAVKTVVLEGA
jgi:hypothetical protein